MLLPLRAVELTGRTLTTLMESSRSLVDQSNSAALAFEQPLPTGTALPFGVAPDALFKVLNVITWANQKGTAGTPTKIFTGSKLNFSAATQINFNSSPGAKSKMNAGMMRRLAAFIAEHSDGATILEVDGLTRLRLSDGIMATKEDKVTFHKVTRLYPLCGRP